MYDWCCCCGFIFLASGAGFFAVFFLGCSSFFGCCGLFLHSSVRGSDDGDDVCVFRVVSSRAMARKAALWRGCGEVNGKRLAANPRLAATELLDLMLPLAVMLL